MSFLYWLEESMLGVWVGQSWGYPLVLSCHAVGMAVVVGTVIMINLRLLGFARAMPVSFFLELSRVTLLGVILNIASGLALFSGNPLKFFYHPAFWIKLVLIVLGSLSLWLGLRKVRLKSPDDESQAIGRTGELVAGFSLLCWLGAIVAGRLIAYFKLF